MKTRPIQVWPLLIAGGLSAMVTAVLGPILPKMQQHFAGIVHVDYWVPLSLMLAAAAAVAVVGYLNRATAMRKAGLHADSP